MSIATFSTVVASGAPAEITLRPGGLAGWNIVLITLDATAAQRVDAYASSIRTMPYVAGLARQGVVYERAYTTVGETGPSHATILSGVTAAVHGVTHNGAPLNPATPWLPALLHARGYFTAGSNVAFFMDKSRGFDRGFDRFVSIPNDKNGHPGGMSTNAAAADQAETLLDDIGSHGTRPFFCWIHLKGGHGPLAPIAPRYLRKFSRSLPADALPPRLAAVMPGWSNKEAFLLEDPTRLVAQAHAYYDASLAEADDAVARLIGDFRSRGLATRTLFIITADHGETFDHGLLEEHGSSPWESTLRIPLIFYSESPRLAVARVRDRLACTIDLAPTIADLLGIEGSAQVEGASLLRSARRHTDAASTGSLTYEEVLRKVVGAHVSKDVPSTLKSEIADQERTGNFYWATLKVQSDGRLLKLIHYGRRSNLRNRSAFIELFDVRRDPGETVDLLQSGAKMRLTAGEMLEDARKRDPLFGRVLSDIVEGVLSNDPDAFTRGLSKEAIETLRSLGYIH